MTNKQLKESQRTLISALDIRHSVSELLGLAHEITLVALNAQITSAQIGRAGQTFSVMTNEITTISGHLKMTVLRIREITHRWTKIIANVTQLMRQMDYLSDAISQLKDKEKQVKGAIFDAHQGTENRLEQMNAQYPRLIRELLLIIDDMEKSLKIVNYVKIGIMIESERLRGAGTEANSPFQHLADEMQISSDKIRSIASRTLEQLRSLSVTTSKPATAY